MEHYVRSDDAELERLAANATHLDDIDLLISERDGALVACAMKSIDGTLRHVCWQCGAFFVQHSPRLRGVEVKWGHSRIMLHAMCEGGKDSLHFGRVFNVARGLQHRRKLARVARASAGVASAAAETAKKIIGI